MLFIALFAAGLGASYALADDGHGNDNGAKGPKCKNVHLQGTIAAQTLTVTLDKGANLNLELQAKNPKTESTTAAVTTAPATTTTP